jgi:DNA polymerase-1
MLESGDVVFIDLSNLVYRAHYTHAALTDSEGNPTSVLFGVPSMILTLLEIASEADLVFCFDSGYPGATQRRSFRYNILPEYKGQRKKDAEKEKVHAQLPELLKFLRICGFATLAVPTLEADDLIGIGTRFVRGKIKGASYFYSNDQDLYQLLARRCIALKPENGGGLKLYTAADLKEEHGLTSGQWSRFKALAGDPSDNIKAIKGLGPVGAKAMILDGVDPSKPDFRMLPQATRTKYPNLRARWTRVHQCFRTVYIPRTSDYSQFSGATKELIDQEFRVMWKAKLRFMTKAVKAKRAKALLEWIGGIESGYLTSRMSEFFKGVTVRK